jgi:hypothetical protein
MVFFPFDWTAGPFSEPNYALRKVPAQTAIFPALDTRRFADIM